MPIYEYTCEECGHKFDSLRSMNEADKPIACKSCHGNKTHRNISVCYTHGTEKASSQSSSSCASCSGGSCAGCGH